MCGIAGFFNHENAILKTAEALHLTSGRGKDGSGLTYLGKTRYFSPDEIAEGTLNISKSKMLLREKELPVLDCIGHNLHSIVGSSKQPLQKEKFAMSINCEIYNWKELNEKYGFKTDNDAETLFKIILKKGTSKMKEILDELDGVFAFCIWEEDTVILARDIMGVKPLWYSMEDGLSFASEKKALSKQEIKNILELNPRTILRYDIKQTSIEKIRRDFFVTTPILEKKEEIFDKTNELVLDAIKKRLPDDKFGILFSGGVDSSMIALVAKKLGRDFTCYTAGIFEEGMEEPEDVRYARKVSESLGVDLKIAKLSVSDVEKQLPQVIELIEDSNVVKVGVALTMYNSCVLAKQDNVKVVFSGLGSEELFAGYERHKKSNDINKECVSGLLKMYERDLYRDDVVSMNNNLELRLPFLDKKLAEHSLRIPPEHKIKEDEGERIEKFIFRKIAEKNGLPKEFACRKKKAAQYGSKFDRALSKIAKKKGLSKSGYLETLRHEKNVPLGVLFSSGKDSTYAMHIMKRQNYDIRCLVTLKSKNPSSYMFHTPNIDLAKIQAEAMEVPIIEKETEGVKEKELKDLKEALEEAKTKYGIEGVVSGALYSNYQRERLEKVCDELDLKIFSPLWHVDQEYEMRQLIKEGYEVLLSSVAAYGLNKSWLGRVLTEEDVDELVRLNQKIGLNIAGEGGEFESLVIGGPLFKRKVIIEETEIFEEDENTAFLIVKKARLENN